MEWFNKIKTGVVFVDLLLVVGAIIAIIGLGIFVHMRGGTPAQPTAQTAPLPLASQHTPSVSEQIEVTEDPVKPPVGNSTEPFARNLQVTPERNHTPVTKPVENVIAPIINRIVTPVCDEVQKSSLIGGYNTAVDDENTIYQNQADSANQADPLSLLTPLEQTLGDLLQAHTSRLDALRSELLSNLSHINCTL